MQCPFKTPVYRAIKSEKHDYYSIRQVVDGGLVCRKMTKPHADYIVRAINSHEKLNDIIFEVARQAIAKYDVNAPPLTKNRFANEFVDSLEQALKEAEKT